MAWLTRTMTPTAPHACSPLTHRLAAEANKESAYLDCFRILGPLQVHSWAWVSTLGCPSNLRKSHVYLFLTDSIHHSHPCFRLCLPPWGPPYLHWAPQVSHSTWPPAISESMSAQNVAFTQLPSLWFQSIKEENAEGVQHLHLCYVHHVLSGSSLWVLDF